jgi:NO-binding membrane sensor protein with MHYT domain
MKVRMSRPVVAVVVMVGAVPPGHFTEVNVAVLPPVPSCTTIKMKDLPAAIVGMVKVQLPVKVTVCTVPLVNDKVWLVPELPIATTLSV